MSKRPIARAQGFVHDIDKVASLSNTPSNMRLLSDRSLYILQNLSGEDVTFLSRYGEILEGGYYLPAEPGTSEASDVYDAISLIRRDLNDMTVEATLECICEQLQRIAGAVTSAQGDACVCSIGTDVETTDGEEGGGLPDPVNGVPYEAADPIADRKCLAANYIHQGIRDVVEELKLSRADGYAYAGMAFVLSFLTTVIGGITLGPIGALAGAVVGSYLSMSLLLFRSSFSLSILLDAIEGDEQGAVCALYDATKASDARDAYVAHLSSEGATSAEIAFVGYMLTNNVLNLLFFAWGDSEAAISGTTPEQDCGVCDDWLHTFDFVTGDEQGWVNDAAHSRPFGVFSAGVGWTSVWGDVGGDFDERLYLIRTFADTDIKIIDVYYTVTSGCGAGAETVVSTYDSDVLKSQDIDGYAGECPSSFIHSLDNTDITIDDIRTSAVGDAAGSGAHDQTITKIVVTGSGTDPF